MKDAPAFPVPSYVNASGETFESSPSGMTMRQYYKAAALSGYLASDDSDDMTFSALAHWCADMADEMLKEDEEHGTK